MSVLAALNVLLVGVWVGMYLFTTFVVSPAFKELFPDEAIRSAHRRLVGRHYARVNGPLTGLLLLVVLGLGLKQGFTAPLVLELAVLLLIGALVALHVRRGTGSLHHPPHPDGQRPALRAGRGGAPMSLAFPSPPYARLGDEQLRRLLWIFYARATQDELLGPVFTRQVGPFPRGGWPVHIARLEGFWRAVLGRPSAYRGQPGPAHADLGLGATNSTPRGRGAASPRRADVGEPGTARPGRRGGHVNRAQPPQVLAATPGGRSLLFHLNAGEGVPRHGHPGARVVIAVLSGELHVTHDGKQPLALEAAGPDTRVLVTLLGGA
ncbi:hypothetical protein DAETH_19540 [Deinococcus aetherius]|uniref:Cupin 2 conserved barrel domain-containing protein n=1 Tax=Deinococcus aetherius TaxID=200252 RepID=A0ABM8ADW9_9DEIO|nr:hypothetical protein [Deinococcus aetherius]BDP41985.1 hypothetical protein DAETH_19540 [Deinococcus aetherius]